MKKNKGFTLIELLAVIVILAIIALIVTPVVSNIVANARIAANARSVEGHIRNIEIAIISEAFSGTTTGDLDSYDNITSGTTIESSLTIPDNDNVTCSSYSIKHGKVESATGCKEKEDNWDKTYTYSISEGAVVFEFKGTVIKPGLDSNGNPTQNKMSNTLSLPMADSEGKSIVTYKGIVYMDPTNVKAVCNQDSTITTTASGCKKFYIYKEDSTSYYMINDRNTTAGVAWVNYDDYIAAGGTTTDWNNSIRDKKGPVTAEAKLVEDTEGWNNTGTVRLITANEIAEIVGARNATPTTILWDSSLPSGTTVGTQSSWFYLDGRRNSNPTTYSNSDGWKKQYCTTQGCSNYAWLYDNTTGCTSYGCNKALSGVNGYWTSDSFSGNHGYAWVVNYSGSLSYNPAKDTIYGIRPVLVIEKSLLG